MESFDIVDAALLEEQFFARDTVTVARELLGHVLVSMAGGMITAGRIVETEAYLGADDLGSHAATKGITKRNRVMYGPPGRAYVYFTYGNHHMLNVVTESEGVAGAVLIRAVEPMVNTAVMAERRGKETSLTDGPGKLAQAFGIDLTDNGTVLGEGRLAIYAGRASDFSIGRSGRIGLSFGHELPLRFYVNGNVHVSKAKTGPALSHGRGKGRTN
ncbi:MAG: DNA-3-methyladenine glycosylase [Coriobacteriia bacterium]|nr:DNA-3-methyladenine glycosylase [Coriobacteriia bacterium]